MGDLAYLKYLAVIRDRRDATEYRFANGEVHWIPKSQVRDRDPRARIVAIPKWFADKKGLASDW